MPRRRTMKIYLRNITIDDQKLIVKWRNSPSVLRHCAHKNMVTLESSISFFNEYVLTEKYKQYIVERVDDDYGAISYPISTVYLKDIDKENSVCELCIFTSDNEEWNTSSQLQAIRILIQKAFEEFKMRKVFTRVIANHNDEIELFLKSGFKKEALLEKEILSLDGTYVDLLRMCIFKANK